MSHHYVSTACQHGLHNRCRDTCKFCGAMCACEGDGCLHGASQQHAEYELRQRIALAIHGTPGIHEGNTSPWEVAGNVIDALKKIGPMNSEEEK